MKRTALRRKTPLKAKCNAEGKPRERFEGLRDEDYRDWIRGKPCAVASPRCVYENHQSDAAHVESKARGAGDAGNLVPLCRRDHDDQHVHGIRSFQREHGVNLRQIAGALWLEYERERGVRL